MNVIERARTRAGLTVQALADLADTSRPAVSAYIHDSKSPRLDTVERLISAAGFSLRIVPRATYELVRVGTQAYWVPDQLPQLHPHTALSEVRLPLHVQWSGGRTYDLADREDRARTYEIVLREGTPDDIDRFVDGALLMDLWEVLVLPRKLRAAWEKAITPVETSG